jgi:hypothetical protein
MDEVKGRVSIVLLAEFRLLGVRNETGGTRGNWDDESRSTDI